METKTLSPQALQVIEHYLHLPFQNQNIATPYFNNRRQKVRGALRVLIGKGSPEDIVEEATIFGLKEKVDMGSISADQMRKFLIDHNIGIDCSGLVYYVLDSELKAQKKSSLKKFLFFPQSENPIRKFLTNLRPVENTGVKTLHDPKNCKTIALENVQPGDYITMIGTGRDHDLNHILLIHEVEYQNSKPKTLSYTHSLAWSSDGKYNHGVRQGKIHIKNSSQSLLDQSWKEKEKTDLENETYWRATTAQELTIDRLKTF